MSLPLICSFDVMFGRSVAGDTIMGIIGIIIWVVLGTIVIVIKDFLKNFRAFLPKIWYTRRDD